MPTLKGGKIFEIQNPSDLRKSSQDPLGKHPKYNSIKFLWGKNFISAQKASVFSIRKKYSL